MSTQTTDAPVNTGLQADAVTDVPADTDAGVNPDVPAETPAVEGDDNPATDPWESLLAVAEMVDAGDQSRRSKVAVPDAVKQMAQRAWDAKQRIVLPYDKNTFEEVSNVFYSAGDLLTPPASVSVVKIKKEAGKADVVVKDNAVTPTHVRITINNRRGSKGKKDDKTEKGEKTA